MKKVAKLFIIFGLIIPAILSISTAALADTNVYDNDQTGWEAEVGSWTTEDFEDGIVGPGLWAGTPRAGQRAFAHNPTHRI